MVNSYSERIQAQEKRITGGVVSNTPERSTLSTVTPPPESETPPTPAPSTATSSVISSKFPYNVGDRVKIWSMKQNEINRIKKDLRKRDLEIDNKGHIVPKGYYRTNTGRILKEKGYKYDVELKGDTLIVRGDVPTELVEKYETKANKLLNDPLTATPSPQSNIPFSQRGVAFTPEGFGVSTAFPERYIQKEEEVLTPTFFSPRVINPKETSNIKDPLINYDTPERKEFGGTIKARDYFDFAGFERDKGGGFFRQFEFYTDEATTKIETSGKNTGFIGVPLYFTARAGIGIAKGFAGMGEGLYRIGEEAITNPLTAPYKVPSMIIEGGVGIIRETGDSVISVIAQPSLRTAGNVFEVGGKRAGEYSFISGVGSGLRGAGKVAKTNAFTKADVLRSFEDTFPDLHTGQARYIRNTPASPSYDLFYERGGYSYNKPTGRNVVNPTAPTNIPLLTYKTFSEGTGFNLDVRAKTLSRTTGGEVGVDLYGDPIINPLQAKTGFLARAGIDLTYRPSIMDAESIYGTVATELVDRTPKQSRIISDTTEIGIGENYLFNTPDIYYAKVTPSNVLQTPYNFLQIADKRILGDDLFRSGKETQTKLIEPEVTRRNTLGELYKPQALENYKVKFGAGTIENLYSREGLRVELRKDLKIEGKPIENIKLTVEQKPKISNTKGKTLSDQKSAGVFQEEVSVTPSKSFNPMVETSEGTAYLLGKDITGGTTKAPARAFIPVVSKIPIQETRTEIKVRYTPILETRTSNFLETDSALDKGIDVKSEIKVNTVFEERIRTDTKPKLKQGTIPILKVAQESRADTITDTGLISRTVKRPPMRANPFFRPDLRTPKPPYTPIFPPEDDKKEKAVAKFGISFKKKGRFEKAGRSFTTEREAFDYGAQFVDTTPLATFRIDEGTGGITPTRKFRKKSKNVFVEKKSFRFDTLGEYSGITAKSKLFKFKKMRL